MHATLSTHSLLAQMRAGNPAPRCSPANGLTLRSQPRLVAVAPAGPARQAQRAAPCPPRRLQARRGDDEDEAEEVVPEEVVDEEYMSDTYNEEYYDEDDQDYGEPDTSMRLYLDSADVRPAGGRGTGAEWRRRLCCLVVPAAVCGDGAPCPANHTHHLHPCR